MLATVARRGPLRLSELAVPLFFREEVIGVLDLEDHIEDILITMTKQLHFIRPLEKAPGVFLYVALDKKAANLGMARMQVKRVETGLSV